MSADNWAICPQCRSKHGKDTELLYAQAEKAYGNVPAEQYKELYDAAREFAVEPIENEFREDYEVRMARDGTFEVSYSGGCRKCGFAHKFHHSEKVKC